jgi:polyphosphate kinase 2 (PPK2 family)
MSTKVYEAEIARLQEELAHLQAWVQKTGARIVIIFEGRGAAGKGGLKRITEKVSRPLIPLTLKVASFIPTERSVRQDVPLD